jgi:hypothetical protein
MTASLYLAQTTSMSLQNVSINIFCEFCNNTVACLPSILNMSGKLLFLKYKLEHTNLLIKISVIPYYPVHKSNCSYRQLRELMSHHSFKSHFTSTVLQNDLSYFLFLCTPRSLSQHSLHRVQSIALFFSTC